MTWDYMAGFFDGEGSVCHNGKGYRITIAQTNEDVLKDIVSFSGVGSVVKVTKRKKHWKDSWVYYIANQKDVHFFLGNILPFLVVKKKHVEGVIVFLIRYLKEKELHEQLVKEKVNHAIKMRAKKRPYREIGEKVGLDWSYVRRILMKRGIH